MSNYRPPKQQLHRDFVYLDHDSVLNSLSALEAGRIDDIIQKTTEALDGSIQAGLNAGPLKGGAGRKKVSEIQQELVRKRTNFSAFEAWYSKLKSESGIGRFDVWDLDVRNQLEVGHVVEFRALVRLSPLHLLFATLSAYAGLASPTNPVFKVARSEAVSLRETAKIVDQWLGGSRGNRSLSVYIEPVPSGSNSPTIVGRVAEKYLTRELHELDGPFIVVVQIENVLDRNQELAAIRVIRDAPATPIETRSIATALASFQGEVSETMGVPITETDITYRYPTVVCRPIAIYR
ncbi:MAG TPA: hypothetical protein VNJ28_07110 [Candidatus Limnocylindrales bacterium]|nr:hypothetical protein [Candidatus Limnocylindrales bacterium]